jgi:hypothetical protein
MFKFLSKYWKELTIVGLIIICLHLSNVFGNRNDEFETIRVNGKDYELLSQTIDTVVVEKQVKVKEYVPTTIYKTDTIKVEIPSDIDTTSILEDYFASYTVVDTLKLDYDFPDGVTTESGAKPSTLGYGVLTDIISKNKIQSRGVDWNFQIPTIYNTTIVKELPKNEFYFGGGLGYSKENFLQTASGGLLWKTKGQKVIGLHLGINNSTIGEVTEFTPFIEGSYFIKFGK